MMKPAIAAAVMILAVGQGPRPAPAPAPRWPDGRINLGAPPGDKGLWERRTEHLVVNPRSYQAPATRNANSFRVIYMDGRGHPANLTPGYFGHSIGRWEGDTLVIDTVGFREVLDEPRRAAAHQPAAPGRAADARGLREPELHRAVRIPVSGKQSVAGVDGRRRTHQHNRALTRALARGHLVNQPGVFNLAQLELPLPLIVVGALVADSWHVPRVSITGSHGTDVADRNLTGIENQILLFEAVERLAQRLRVDARPDCPCSAGVEIPVRASILAQHRLNGCLGCGHSRRRGRTGLRARKRGRTCNHRTRLRGETGGRRRAAYQRRDRRFPNRQRFRRSRTRDGRSLRFLNRQRFRRSRTRDGRSLHGWSRPDSWRFAFRRDRRRRRFISCRWRPARRSRRSNGDRCRLGHCSDSGCLGHGAGRLVAFENPVVQSRDLTIGGSTHHGCHDGVNHDNRREHGCQQWRIPYLRNPSLGLYWWRSPNCWR